jgi:hypothetical protein
LRLAGFAAQTLPRQSQATCRRRQVTANGRQRNCAKVLMQAAEYQMRGFGLEPASHLVSAAEHARSVQQNSCQALVRATRPSAVGEPAVYRSALQTHPLRSTLAASRTHSVSAAALRAVGLVSAVPSLHARQRWPVSSSLSQAIFTRAPDSPPNSGFAVIAPISSASGYFSYVCTAPAA